MHYPKEDEEIQSQDGSDGINPAPRAREMLSIPRVDRYQQYERRNDTKLDGGRDSVKRKEKTRHRSRDCGDQEPFGPTVETFAGEQSKQNDEAGKNCDQAEQCVNNRVDVQYHFVTPFGVLRGRPFMTESRVRRSCRDRA